METKMIQKEDKKLFTIDLISRSVSSFGDLIFYPVMLAIAASMENPAGAMLLVSLSESIPIFLAVFIGVFADRLNNIFKSMHVLNFIRFVLYLISAALFFVDMKLAFYATIIINFFSDCLGKMYNPLANSMMVTYADEATMIEKQGVLSSVNGVVQIFAPLLGTVLLATLNYGVIGIANALTFLATSFVLLIAKKQFRQYSNKVAVARKVGKEKTDTYAQIKKSFNFIFKNNSLTLIVLCCLVINMFTIPIVRIILPIFLMESGMATAESVATAIVFMNIMFAVGNILGSLGSRIFKKFPMFRTFALSIIVMAALMIVMAFQTNMILLNVIFFFIGIVSGVINTLFMGYLMQIVTQDIMGGVTNAVTLITAGGGIVGDLVATSLLSIVASASLVKIISALILVFGIGVSVTTWKKTELLLVEDNEPLESGVEG